MDPILAALVVIVAVAAAVAWFVRRNRHPAVSVEEEWTPPPADGPATSEPFRQVLTREALLNPDRRLDPSRWDNSPDGGTEEVEGDLPTHFDREYLRRRQEE